MTSRPFGKVSHVRVIIPWIFSFFFPFSLFSFKLCKLIFMSPGQCLPTQIYYSSTKGGVENRKKGGRRFIYVNIPTRSRQGHPGRPFIIHAHMMNGTLFFLPLEYIILPFLKKDFSCFKKEKRSFFEEETAGPGWTNHSVSDRWERHIFGLVRPALFDAGSPPHRCVRLLHAAGPPKMSCPKIYFGISFLTSLQPT